MACVGSWKRRGACGGPRLLLPASTARALPPSRRDGATRAQTELRLPGQRARVSPRLWVRSSSLGPEVLPIWKKLRRGSQAQIRLNEDPPLRLLTFHRPLDPPQCPTRDYARYEGNVLQVKVKSHSAFCLEGGTQNQRMIQFQ